MEANGVSTRPDNPVAGNLVSPGTGDGAFPETCPTCGAGDGAPHPASPAYVYAVGKIEPRFPRISVEKEFAQVAAREETAGLTERRLLQTILTRPENRYLVRQMCWVFSISGLETYILLPSDPHDVSLLTDALRPNAGAGQLDVVIGRKGPLAPAEMCNGLTIPLVAFDQIYSFDRDALISAIPRPQEEGEAFTEAARELLDRILLMTDNAGSADEHRALNYLAMRYPGIYARTAEALKQNAALSAVEARPSPLAGTRTILDIIFSYTNRNTDVTDKCFVRVDVGDEFPFLVSKLTPWYDR